MLEQFGLEPWQLVLLGIAGAVLVTMFFDKNKTTTVTPEPVPVPPVPPTPTPEPTPVVPPVVVPDDHNIKITIPHCEPNKDMIRLVCAWSSFKRECVKSGIPDAVTKVDEIFPLLIGLNGGDHAEQ